MLHRGHKLKNLGRLKMNVPNYLKLSNDEIREYDYTRSKLFVTNGREPLTPYERNTIKNIANLLYEFHRIIDNFARNGVESNEK